MAIWKWLVGFGVLCGAYVLLVGTISLSEALAAIPAVLGGLGFAFVIGRCGARSMVVRAPWGRLLARLGLMLAKDIVVVGGALLRSLVKPVAGAMSLQPFEPGGDRAEAAGRRAALILGVSLAPNGYVVRVTDDALLLHRLAPAAAAPDARWPL